MWITYYKHWYKFLANYQKDQKESFKKIFAIVLSVGGWDVKFVVKLAQKHSLSLGKVLVFFLVVNKSVFEGSVVLPNI